MTRTRDRVIIWVIAILFIFTSVGIGAGAIWQVVQDNKARKEAEKTSQTVTKEGTKMQDFTPVEKVTELQKIDLQEGTGAEVKATDTLTVDYVGAFAATGIVFESNEGATFPLNGVIQGWQEGLVGVKEGGKRRLLIPSALAYGEGGSGSIPANSDLVFDVTIRKIGQ